MKVPDHIFRGYDIRGVMGEDLSEEIMEKLGKGYGTFLYRRRINEIVLQHDNRNNSVEYKDAFKKGVLSTGVNVIDCGLGLTPTMYFAQYEYKTNGGAMITGSHNEKEWNGMKLAVGYSDTMISEEIQETRRIIEKGKFMEGQGKEREENVFPSYKKALVKRVDLKKKFKVVVDALHGTTGQFIPEILRAAGCEVIEQNCSPDGNFPKGAPDPTEKKAQEMLAEGVKKHKADLGFSFDTDGDRIGIVDSKGTIVWNDVFVALLARDIISYLPKAKIVYNTLCSKVVDDVIKEAGGDPIMWLTGHSFIKAKLREERAPFGGELSGHFFFADNFFGHDDGAYAALRFLQYLSNDGRPLHEILEELPKYISSPEIKINTVSDKRKVEILDDLTERYKKDFKDEKVVDIDGVRVTFNDGMLIVRYSQNGPYITVKFEAKDKGKYEERRAKLYNDLKEYEGIKWDEGTNLESFIE